MRKMLICPLVVIIFSVLDARSAPTHDDTIAPTDEALRNCVIKVTTKYKDGDQETTTHTFHFKLKSQCLKTGSLLSKNFDPHRITKVTSKADWIGK
ncbi:MAG: hypothetical protein JNJ49_12020 [Bdellovibrionaceae bacterium]|nr:hypothetical protein [Pseudobdellovibrionaceae bacterium]